MKFTAAVLALVVSAMTVSAVPIAEADANAVADVYAAPVEVEALETRDLTRGQCKNACDRGADAMEAFCRRIPDARIRLFCWGAAAAIESPLGQRACVSFCDNFF